MKKFKGRMSAARIEALFVAGAISSEQAEEMKKAAALESARVQFRKKVEKKKVEEAVEAALSDAEVRERLKFTAEDIAVLNGTIHAPGRHAMAVQAGLKLKAMVNGLLDRQRDGEAVTVTVTTVTPGAAAGYEVAGSTSTTRADILPSKPRVIVDEMDDDTDEEG